MLLLHLLFTQFTFWPSGILEDSPANADHIGSSRDQEVFGFFYGLDAASQKDGDGYIMADCRGHIPEIPRLRMIRPDKEVHSSRHIDQVNPGRHK